jgi:hypothetical protein
MAEEKNKKPKTYSLSPFVISWVTQKAAEQTIENGERSSESRLVEDILTEKMMEDGHIQRIASKVKPKIKNYTRRATD